MKDLWRFLKETEKPIVLYGMGDGAEKVISALNIYGIKVSGVFASDGFVRQKTFMGFTVTDYKTAKEKFGDMVVLVCFGTALFQVLENIKRIKAENILFAPDVPVYGGPVFDSAFADKNKEKIETVFDCLADELSRKCYKNIIEYKQTGNIDLLFDCQSEKDELYNLLNLGDNETYFDLGAYRGDTVFEFTKRVKDYKKIIAVEPDLKTFNKLKAATADIKNLCAVNSAVSDFCGRVAFSGKSSRGSSIGKGEDIPCTDIDTLIKDGCTYIKMDIEGAELAAIEGARQTITGYRPKLRIAAYHRSEDIFEIPIKVLSICKDYKVYIRHLPCLPAWDTDFIFIPN